MVPGERREGDPPGDAKVGPVHDERGARRVERRSRKEGQKARASEVPDMGLEAKGKDRASKNQVPDMGLEPMIFFACGGPRIHSSNSRFPRAVW